ncbi:hypothetical protein NEUTE1DRAFT_104309 [Neurospora tetrasperma FGSC 2508]|uniref:Uncharacterized protein n=1 Tax=Neurospora tetrasperma (strain FGSC 2508 / ATCC MYA-4615 / P0657) TaxID=510951 RepID=F8MWB1_NEUT8|nr:uncharacterized protein NEUTE1DRAFT_104309 [Neurospora tetrasperma FGSC 2508]EGO54906.1 hypothetical protein NEUTE1DRAFT_104309 [Neurospora tetrasperma FGSC 2508]
MTDILPYRHADGAHGDDMVLWPDEQEIQPLPANVSLLMETTAWFGLNTPQDQGHRAYPDATGETGLYEGGDGDDLLNRNGVIEQPDFNTANNAQVFSPLLSQAKSPSPSVAARPSEVDMVNIPSTHGRRYTCQPCSFSSNTKRDFKRHQNTRKHQSNATRSMATLDVNIDGQRQD